MKDIIREEARLIILRALHEDINYSSNDSMLQAELERFGIARSRDWIKEELNYLDNVGAIKKFAEGTVYVAKLAPKGVEHVERRLVITGVKRPSPPEA